MPGKGFPGIALWLHYNQRYCALPVAGRKEQGQRSKIGAANPANRVDQGDDCGNRNVIIFISKMGGSARTSPDAAHNEPLPEFIPLSGLEPQPRPPDVA